MTSSSEVSLPTAADLQKIAARAIALYGARCVQRVEPLLAPEDAAQPNEVLHNISRHVGHSIQLAAMFAADRSCKQLPSPRDLADALYRAVESGVQVHEAARLVAKAAFHLVKAIEVAPKYLAAMRKADAEADNLADASFDAELFANDPEEAQETVQRLGGEAGAKRAVAQGALTELTGLIEDAARLALGAIDAYYDDVSHADLAIPRRGALESFSAACWLDFERLRPFVRTLESTHTLHIDSDELGPLWSERWPDWWASDTGPPEEEYPEPGAGEAKLALEIEIPEGVSDEEVIEQLRELAQRADAYHRAQGGRGLKIEDLEIYRESGIPQGVHNG